MECFDQRGVEAMDTDIEEEEEETIAGIIKYQNPLLNKK